MYEAGIGALRETLGEAGRRRIDACWRELEVVTGGWASLAAGLLRELILRAGGRAGGCFGEAADGLRTAESGQSLAPEASGSGGGDSHDHSHRLGGRRSAGFAATAVKHVIVTRGQLLASLAKLMLFGFGDLVK